MTPVGYDITKGLETQHVCNELEFNSLLGACVEKDCGYHGMCKKYPSKKIIVWTKQKLIDNSFYIAYLVVYSHQKYILVVPDNFIPEGSPIEIEGTTIGDESDNERYLYFDFSEYFGKDKDSDGFKEVILQRGQFLGIAEGQIGYR